MGNFVPELTGTNYVSFDNTSQYLATVNPMDSKYVFTGDFTIEAWIYLNALPTTAIPKWLISSWSTASLGKSFAVQLTRDSGGQYSITLLMSTDGITTQTTSAVIPFLPVLSTWYHIAVVRTSSIVYFFVNGIEIGNSNTANLGSGTSTTFAHTNYNGPYSVVIGADPQGSTSFWNGYISNLRVVNGVGVYTAAPSNASAYSANTTISYLNLNPDLTKSFTPPLTSVASTQSSSTNILAITGTATSLITCQSGSYADTSTFAQPMAAAGFAASLNRANYSGAAFSGYYAVNFVSASTTFLSAPANAGYAFGTGDFTVEAWVNPTTLVVSAGLVGPWTGTAATSSWLLSMGTTNAANVKFSVANTTVVSTFESTSNGGLTTGVWSHVAAVRIGTTLSIYTNGVKTYTGTGTAAEQTNITYASGACQIGAFNSTNPFNGYISNVRVTKGTGIYTGNFTPIFTPLANSVSTTATNIANVAVATSTAAGVQLLVARSRTLIDNSFQSLTITTSATAPTVNTTITPAFVPTAKSDMQVVLNNNNYITLPASSAYNAGTGNFTFETWVYFNSLTSNPTIAGQYPSTTTGAGNWVLWVSSGGLVRLNYDGATQIATTAPVLTVGVWYHIAVQRSGTAYSVFVNGTVATTGTASSAAQFGNTSNQLWIGAQQIAPTSNGLTGYISNPRYVLNNALYVSPFTPLITSFALTQSSGTNINSISSAATVSLLLQANSSGVLVDNSSAVGATLTFVSNSTALVSTSTTNSLISSTKTVKQHSIPGDARVNKYKVTLFYDNVSSSIRTIPDIGSISGDTPVVLHKISHSFEDAAVKYAVPPNATVSQNIPVVMHKFTHTSDMSGPDIAIPNRGTINLFNDQIVSTLYKQLNSTTYQFWS